MLNFELAVETEGTSALVTIRGDLDLQVAERVAQELTGIEASEPEVLVLDLHGLTFLDSSGMGVIAAAHARATAAGRRFALVAPRPLVIRAFEVSGLADTVTMLDDVGEVYP